MTKKILFPIIIIIFSLFIFINLSASQSPPSLFLNLVNQQKKSEAILFLKKIKKTKEFSQQLEYFKNIYGKTIEKEVFAEEEKRRKEIKKLESLLEKNEKARDVLINLAVLYFKEKDFKKAKEYYQKAKGIDPMVKIDDLEKIR